MWRLVGNTATWRCSRLRVSIALQHPDRGLGDIVFQEHSLPDTSLQQMQLAAAEGCESVSLTDCYTRGSDLIATYEDAGQRVRPQVYWRVSPVEGLQDGPVMIESFVSTQTDLPESNPTVDFRCQLPATRCEVFRAPGAPAEVFYAQSQVEESIGIDCGSSGAAVAFHLAESPVTFAQVFQPTDVVYASLTRDRSGQFISSTVSLFCGRVERGVIRRTRLRGILAPANEALGVMHELWKEMLTAPPPLTT